MYKNVIYVVGCGGHARSIINIFRQMNEKREIILIDSLGKKNEVIMGCKVVVSTDDVSRNDYLSEEYIVGLGNNIERERIFRKLLQNNKNILKIISPYAVIGKESMIGKGSFIGSNSYIGPQVKIGDNTIINTGSIVEHESFVGSHTHIATGATVCGRTRIGDFVMIGAGSTIIDKIRIADKAIVGAGSTVIKDILEPGTYIGTPARKIN
ncbi:MAG: acetyltransferase [Lachnospiraceae bacterium]|nr:acetyltransferase [Lachnospiraceae bacterium]MCI9658112.1 acetyltransferase [Lachnospiraceae bacterium]